MAFELDGRVLLPGMVIRHLCNNTRCCNPQHLKLGTALENMADKARSGIVAAEKCPRASLSNKQALAVYALRGKMTAKLAAAKTGATIVVVRNIWNGESYASITGATRAKKGRPTGESNHAATVSNKQAKTIYAMKERGVSAASVARRHCLPAHIVRNIWSGATYSQITGAKKADRKRPFKVIRCMVCQSVIEGVRYAKWCSMRCALSANVRTASPDECWIWTARSKSRGYGQVQSRGRRAFAHHVAFDLAFPDEAVRRRAERLTISHRCHEPLCCNPSHLELLTLEANVKNNRGRANVSGEANHQTKLTLAVATRIVEMISAGERSVDIIRRIKQQDGVTVTMTQVTDIRRGRTWKYIPRV